jgi:imidazolonepropionase
MRTAIIGIGSLATLAGPPGPRRGAAMGDLGLMESAALAIEAGAVRWIGKTSDWRPHAGERVLDAAGRLVTPGFVDCHTHAVFAEPRAEELVMRAQGRSYAEIAAAGGGILSSMRALRAMPEGELLRRSIARGRAFLAGGTTAIEVKTGYGLDLESEAKMIRVARRMGETLGLRVRVTYLGLHAKPPEFESHDAYVRDVLERQLPVLEDQVDFVDIFVEPGYFQAEHAEALARASRKPLRMHVDQRGDHGGAALAARLGAISADHLEYTGPAGIAALARSETIPVLLPISVFGLGKSRYPEARAMIAAGLPVALATDYNPGTAPSASMTLAMALAVLHMGMTPAECLTATTVNAAAALGQPGGQLVQGKPGTAVLHDVARVNELPYALGRPTAVEIVS